MHATQSLGGGLEEKVKECGRLIVRMGTELMEETKRRQVLEADLQELRMRLSGMEAVSRLPVPNFNVSQYEPDFNTSSHTYDAFASHAGIAGGTHDGFRPEMHPVTPAPPLPQDFTSSQYCPPQPSTAFCSGSVGGSGGLTDRSLPSRCHEMVDSRLRDLMPSAPTPTSYVLASLRTTPVGRERSLTGACLDDTAAQRLRV